MIDLSEEQSTEDGGIGVGLAASSSSGTVSREPGVSGASINPEGQTSARDKSFVIFSPVADAVLLFVLCGHASRLADVSPPRLFVQQRLAKA